MPRIMQVAYSFAIGGSEMVARDIALGLMQAGWPAGICALEHDGPLRAELEAQGVATTVIAKQGRGVLGPMYRLWRAFRAFRPEVVHTHHIYELIYAWPGALLCGARLVHTEHEFHSLSWGRNRQWLWLLAKLCRTVTAVNEETATYLREVVKVPAAKVVTVVNGVDLQHFSAAVSARGALRIDASVPLLGIVARLEPPKDHSLLFRALRRLLARFPHACLLVVGEGSLRGQLEALAAELGLAEHIVFLGARRDIPQLLAALDLFVLCSDLEGLPVALLEAMAAGLPVVATATGGIPAVVKAGETGLLVQPGDEAGLFAALQQLLADREQAQTLGRQAADFVRRHYAAATVQARYREIYQQCLADGRAEHFGRGTR